MKNAWELFRTSGADGKVYATNNVHINPSWSTSDPSSIEIPGTDILGAMLNPPPYAYTPGDESLVPTLVMDGAGVGKGLFAP